MARTAEEFAAAAAARGITRWPTRGCRFCEYKMAYLIEGNAVFYDSGCWCIKPQFRLGPEPRVGFEDIAAFYNMQTHPDAIAEMDAFWAFA